MNLYLLAIAIVFCTMAAGVLGAPVYVLWRAPRHSPEVLEAARSRIIPSAIALVVAAAAWGGISFAYHLMNMAAGIVALCCGVFLCLFLFQLRPKWLTATLGALAMLLMLVAILAVLLDMLFSGHSTTSVATGDGLVCEEFPSGFAGNSDETLDVYRRYLFIDRRLVRHSLLDARTGDAAPTAAESASMQPCLVALKLQWYHAPAR